MFAKVAKIIFLFSSWNFSFVSAGGPQTPCDIVISAFYQEFGVFANSIATMSHEVSDAMVAYDAAHESQDHETFETNIRAIAAPYLDSMTKEKDRFIAEVVPAVFGVTQIEAYSFFELFEPAGFPLNCTYPQAIYETYYGRHQGTIDYMNHLIRQHKSKAG